MKPRASLGKSDHVAETILRPDASNAMVKEPADAGESATAQGTSDVAHDINEDFKMIGSGDIQFIYTEKQMKEKPRTSEKPKREKEVLKPNQYLPLQNIDLVTSVSNKKSTRALFGSMVLEAGISSPTGSITNKVLSVRNARNITSGPFM